MKEKYKKEYCKQVVEFMKEGYSFEAFAGKIGVGRQTLYDWSKRHPEFEKAHKAGMAACQLKWEQMGMEGMFMGGKDNPFQASMYNFSMSARFGWSQKKESKIESDSLAALIMETVKDDDDAPGK